MSLVSLCKCSRFIDVLIKNGYDNTLTTLLHDLNLDEFPCDINNIIALLWGANNRISDELINKIGIENAITICDELCVSRATNAIIEKKIMLNKLLEHQIINHNIVQDYISIYNRGYRIIIGNDHVNYNHHCESFINNAYNNGLYTHYVHIVNNKINMTQIMQCALNDVRKIRNTRLETLASCKNVEIIDNLRCDGTEPLSFAKNIKKISIYKFNGNCVNLEQFTQLCELDTNGAKLLNLSQLPQTLRVLCAHNTYLHDWVLSTCTRLKKLDVANNPYITTCAPFAQYIVKLRAIGSCGINDDGLRICHRLKILATSFNPKITMCKPFAKTLRKLIAWGNCGIDNNGLQMCYHLKILDARGNPKITIQLPITKTEIDS